MAFDGITIANIVYELSHALEGGRLYKIAQTEKDELQLVIKCSTGNHCLSISVNPSLPLIYITENKKQAPMQAPLFSMVLRKHLQGGKIISISQPKLERIIVFDIEHSNEMGDKQISQLIVELMGKHSNIILIDQNCHVIDSIKRISAQVSSLREILPGKEYFVPDSLKKANPINTNRDEFLELVFDKNMELTKSLYTAYMGISPQIANEICYRSRVDGNSNTTCISDNNRECIYIQFDSIMQDVISNNFSPTIVYENNEPAEYSSIHLTSYDNTTSHKFTSIFELLEQYYQSKNTISRIRQKSYDLRRIVQTALERNVRKYQLQLKQIEDTKKRETMKLYGELLMTYGHQAPEGSKIIEVINYYTNEPIIIPLDPTITAIDNAKKYYNKYSKLKRTYEALSELIISVEADIEYLNSILTSLDIVLLEEDLSDIRRELMETGYIRHRPIPKDRIKSKPLHYISSDGYDIFVGKNNYQNDDLTFKIATANDWWFHAKKIPGSHVIVKSRDIDLPDSTFEDAARLAAYYSSGRQQPKVEIDYTMKKNIKKPSGGKPGLCIYHTNYSMSVDSDISNITEIR